MARKWNWIKLSGLALVAPLAASCAQTDDRMMGPPIPAPLNVRQAAEVAQRHVGENGRLSYIDDTSDGQLFGVTRRSEGDRGPFAESRLLFVHDDGTVGEWPGGGESR